jgi:hypothetical protein
MGTHRRAHRPRRPCIPTHDDEAAMDGAPDCRYRVGTWEMRGDGAGAVAMWGASPHGI